MGALSREEGIPGRDTYSICVRGFRTLSIGSRRKLRGSGIGREGAVSLPAEPLEEMKEEEKEGGRLGVPRNCEAVLYIHRGDRWTSK